MDGTLSPDKTARHKFTVDDVLRMIDAGIIDEKARVELRGGELIDMAAEGARHSNVKSDLIVAIAGSIKGRHRMGADTPLRLADDEWPEPDLFLTPLSIRPADARGPDTLLVVEVADTSLAADLGENAALYARFGVREYWVVDLVNSLVHVHKQSGEGVFGSPQIAKSDELISPGLVDGVAIRLTDLL